MKIHSKGKYLEFLSVYYSYFLILTSILTINSQTTSIQTAQAVCNEFGQFWDGQKCEKCASPQCACTTYNSCESCLEGWVLTDNLCIQCDKVPYANSIIKSCCVDQSFQTDNTYIYAIRAIDCKKPLINEQDESTVQFYSGYCHYIVGCQKYLDFGICSECASGYYKNVLGTCSPCMSNCKSCLADKYCTICSDGYYLDTTRQGHETPASVCLECDSQTRCYCNDSFNKCNSEINGGCRFTDEFYFERQCLSCIQPSRFPNSLQCTSKTIIKCAPGYVKVTNNAQDECQKCPLQCNACNYVEQIKVCYECAIGTYYDSKSNSCLPCSGQGVERCNSVNTPIQCSRKDFLDVYIDDEKKFKFLKYHLAIDEKDNTQVACVTNKFLCQMMGNKQINSGLCADCYPGYVLSELLNCVKCGGGSPTNPYRGCQECVRDNLSRVKCVSCLPGFYMKAGACTECPSIAICMTCAENTGVCTQCINGYILVDQICRPCNDKFCSVCEIGEAGKQVCRLCMSYPKTYALVESLADKTVKYCDTCGFRNCVQCDTRNICLQCNTGYYLNGSGDCESVINSNCASWQQDGSCELCSYGYRNVNGLCRKCVSLESGYINCQASCITTIVKYKKDNQAQNSTIEQSSVGANILSFNLLAIILLTGYVLPLLD